MDGDKLEDIIDSTIASEAELDAQKTDNPNVENGTSGATEPQKENGGWFTSLPKEFRDDARNYGSMKEYLTALNKKDGQPSENAKPAEDEWDGFLEGIESGVGEANAPIYSILRESGVSVEASKKVISGMEEQAKTAMENAKHNLTPSMRELWKDDYGKNMKAAQRGILALQKVDSDMVKMMKDTGLLWNPAVVNVVSILGRNTSEVAPPIGHTDTTKTYDPSNPLGFGKMKG